MVPSIQKFGSMVLALIMGLFSPPLLLAHDHTDDTPPPAAGVPCSSIHE